MRDSVIVSFWETRASAASPVATRHAQKKVVRRGERGRGKSFISNHDHEEIELWLRCMTFFDFL